MDINELLAFCVKQQASDLHLSAGMAPMLRINGDMVRLNTEAIDAEALQAMLDGILDGAQQSVFKQQKELDLSYALPAVARFRANLFYQQRGPGAVFRAIPQVIPSLEELQAPPILAELVGRRHGLILVTGPTGSGKTTTLAAMIDHRNTQQQGHILTIEDPIEFVHSSKRCLINQREVYQHSQSFDRALRAALREDPDVILVGELRDLETMRLALTAAETGHLVLATLHTRSPVKAVERIVDVFPTEEKGMVRTMLAESLQGIVSQTLVKAQAGGRVAAYEVLLATPAVRNLIREEKSAQITSIMQTAQAEGMITLERSLDDLVGRGMIEAEVAREISQSLSQG